MVIGPQSLQEVIIDTHIEPVGSDRQSTPGPPDELSSQNTNFRAKQRERAAIRWKAAVQTVVTMRKLFEYHDCLGDRDSDPDERLYAIIQLTIYFKGDGDIKPKLLHIRRLLSDTTTAEQVFDEVNMTGQRIYDWFTPSKMGSHVPWFTVILTFLMVGVYAYMCADFRNYKTLSYGPHVGDALGETFDFTFLDTWRGFSPDLVRRGGQDARWFVSVIEHDGLQHISANLCLFCLVGYDLEHKYGTTRISIISFAAAVGGNLMAAVAENPCGIIVGASGLIFGLVAFWICDLIINFHFINYIIIRSVFSALFFGFFLITVFTQAHVSNWSHFGGFLSGTFLSLMCLPRLGKQRIEAAFLWIGLFGTLLYFLILPLVAELVVFPRIANQCQNVF